MQREGHLKLLELFLDQERTCLVEERDRKPLFCRSFRLPLCPVAPARCLSHVSQCLCLVTCRLPSKLQRSRWACPPTHTMDVWGVGCAPVLLYLTSKGDTVETFYWMSCGDPRALWSSGDSSWEWGQLVDVWVLLWWTYWTNYEMLMSGLHLSCWRELIGSSLLTPSLVFNGGLEALTDWLRLDIATGLFKSCLWREAGDGEARGTCTSTTRSLTAPKNIR